MNNEFLTICITILVIALVESQELQCGCDANEYCFRPNIPFVKLSLCLPYKRRGAADASAVRLRELAHFHTRLGFIASPAVAAAASTLLRTDGRKMVTVSGQE
ncbi:hypothetical protein TNIN_99411 [Trichonephila inaurata madagascariensis]|uniref:Uncharacterized protein n=1 Tax=Trichonephila inaurata madagascariensis TaxID=2747483 RepID=A0A8X6I826_9ARAC|nr:hypothetical protein TNIN_99411 [Trichonephila inaurata madagascariensis]